MIAIAPSPVHFYLPESVLSLVICETCALQPVFQFLPVDFKVFTEFVKALIGISELHVSPTQEHDGVFGEICHDSIDLNNYGLQTYENKTKIIIFEGF